MKRRIGLETLTFIYTLSFLLIWNNFANKIILYLLFNLGFIPANVCYKIVSTIPLIVCFELVGKVIFTQGIPNNVKFTPIQLETLPQIDINSFNYYTNALESLGFVRLSDLQLSEYTIIVARIFSHPEHLCIVEILQVIERPLVLCAITSLLEQEWSISFRNDSYHKAIVYAFLRRPRGIVIFKQGATPDELLRSHLEFRQQIMDELNLQVLPDISIETYFEQSQRARTLHRQALWQKSIIFGLIKMALFSWKSKKQKSQWLGDFARLTARKG
jgi:hypothetical protein